MSFLKSVKKSLQSFIPWSSGAKDRKALQLIRSVFTQIGSVLSNTFGGLDVWPKMDSRKAIEKGYAQILAIFAIVNKDAAKFGCIPRYVYDVKSIESGKGAKVVSGSRFTDLLKLLKQPNPYQTQSEFYEGARIMYKNTGEAFIWLNRGDVAQKMVEKNGNIEFIDRTDQEIDRMPVLEMYVLPSGFVGIIPDPDNVFGCLGYWFDINGNKKFIRKGDIIHWKRHNPVFDPVTGDHLHGLAPNTVGNDTITEHREIIKSSRRMFKNDGVKAIMIDESGAWQDYTESQRDAMTDKMNEKLNSNDLKGAIATLGGKWNYVAIAQKSVDLDMIAAKRFTWQELCFLYDIPFEFFDTNTKYNNAGERQKQWVSNTIIPACQLLDEKMTSALSMAFNVEELIKICSDPTQLPEMQKDLKTMAEAFEKMWYVSPNQKLVAMGYEPIDDKTFDEPWIPPGTKPLSQWSAEDTFNEESDNMEDDEY